MTSECLPTSGERRFQWSSTSDGKWQRDLDEAEEFYVTFSRPRGKPNEAAFPITGFASFTAEQSVDSPSLLIAFRNAWATLRHEITSMAAINEEESEIEDGSAKWKKKYEPLGTGPDGYADLSPWLDLTFRQVLWRDNTTMADWFNSDCPPVPKFPTLYLLIGDDADGTPTSEVSGSIFLRAPHDVVDGIGMLRLLDRIFEIASEYGIGSRKELHLSTRKDEQLGLSLPLRVAAGFDDEAPEATTRRCEEIMKENHEAQMTAPFLGLPFSASDSSAPQSHKRVAVKIPEATRAQITKECKALGVSVSHVFHAAIALCLRDMQPDPEQSARYLANILIDLRSLCGSTHQTTQSFASIYHMLAAKSMVVDVKGWSQGVDLEHDYKDVLKTVHDYYKLARPTPQGSGETSDIAMAPLTWKLFTPADAPDTSNTLMPAGPVTLSSLGKISSLVAEDRKPFVINDVWVCGVPIGPGVAVFLSTWNSEIGLSATFDTHWHDARKVQEYLERIQACVVHGLNISV